MRRKIGAAQMAPSPLLLTSTTTAISGLLGLFSMLYPANQAFGATVEASAVPVLAATLMLKLPSV